MSDESLPEEIPADFTKLIPYASKQQKDFKGIWASLSMNLTW